MDSVACDLLAASGAVVGRITGPSREAIAGTRDRGQAIALVRGLGGI